MFAAIAIGYLAFMLWLHVKWGPQEALWGGWLVAMLIVPTWLVKGMGSITLDVRTLAAVIGLSGYFVLGSGLRFRFAVMDALILALFAALVTTAVTTNSMALMTVPELARRWLLPYLVGRVFIGSARELPRFLPLVAIILVVLSGLAATEALTKTNLFCQLFGKTFAVLEAGEGYRWGIKRAIGPLGHPIYFGMTLVMTLPFAVLAAAKSLREEGPRWWLGLPVAVFAAVGCTASRGPILAAMVAVYASFTFATKRLRWALLLSAVVAGYGGWAVKDAIKDVITSSVETGEVQRWVEIEGQEYAYTGTAHRELLLLVYADAVADCPWFGYGGRLLGVSIAEHLAERFSSIDNHYLRFYLQHGPVGIALFLAITITAILTLGRLAWDVSLPYSILAGSMLGALLGVSTLLMTVWFAPDHGTVWLFFVGLSTCLGKLPREAVERDDASRDVTPAVELSPPPLQLVPGHPPLATPSVLR